MTQTWVGQSGTTHTGSGHQYVFPSWEGLLKDSRGKSPRAVAEDELQWLLHHFEEPDGYGTASETLEERGVVLLAGRPGDGLNATARVLLSNLPPESRTLRELSVDEDGDKDKAEKGNGQPALLDPQGVDENDRLLLDLSGTAPAQWVRIEAELSAFRHAVHTRGAALAVVLPELSDEALAPALVDLRHRITRFDGMEREVVRLHLARAGLDPGAADGMPLGLLRRIAGVLPLRQVARLAQVVCEAVREEHEYAEAWLRAERFLRQPEEAAKALGTVRKGAQRALLVSSAMLHGAPAGAVHRGTELLLGASRPDPEVRDLLARRPLSERLDRISARIDGSGRVRFTEPDHDQALRTQVWQNFPDLRDHLSDWTEKAVSLPELSDADRDRLVGRFAAQCLSTGHTGFLTGLVERWTGADQPALRRAAAQALTHGLGDRGQGGFFRRQIREWSTRSQLPSLRRVLVEVCSDVLLLTHPEQALVRLHHLARHESQQGMARYALARAVRDDHRLLRRLLFRFVQYGTSADPDLFLDVSAPEPLLDPGTRTRPLLREGETRAQVTACWATVFQYRPQSAWASPVAAWFDAVRDDGTYDGVLLGTLVAGCRHRGDRLALLYHACLVWAASRPGTDLPDRLRHRIRTDQLLRSGSPGETTAP